MCGNKHAAFVRLQHHLQQIFRIQTENRASVGSNVADGRELGGQGVGAFQRRHVHEIVNLADRPVLFVDGADFRLNEEERVRRVRGTNEAGNFFLHGNLLPNAVQTCIVVEHEVAAQFLTPCGMGEVPCGHDGQALDQAPGRQIADVQSAAGGAGETGMDVKVGAECFHGGSLA